MSQQQKTIGIHFGALADDLSVQLNKQGFKYDKKEIEHFQLDINAANRLRIRGVLVDSVYDKVLSKLHKKIVSSVAKTNKLDIIK